MLRDLDTMRREWSGGMTGVVPTKPGYYWVFVQEWRMTEVIIRGGRLISKAFPGDEGMLVSRICPDRWGSEF
jgi:hypothetical protein